MILFCIGILFTRVCTIRCGSALLIATAAAVGVTSCRFHGMPAAAHLPQTLGYFNQPRPPLSRLPAPIKFDRIVNRAEYNEVIARLYKELKVRAVTVEVLGRRRYRVTSPLLTSTFHL